MDNGSGGPNKDDDPSRPLVLSLSQSSVGDRSEAEAAETFPTSEGNDTRTLASRSRVGIKRSRSAGRRSRSANGVPTMGRTLEGTRAAVTCISSSSSSDSDVEIQPQPIGPPTGNYGRREGAMTLSVSSASNASAPSMSPNGLQRTPPGGVPRHLLEEALAFANATTGNSHSDIDPHSRYMPRNEALMSQSQQQQQQLLGTAMGSAPSPSYASLLAQATAHMMAAATAAEATSSGGGAGGRGVQPLVRLVSSHNDEADQLTAQTLGGLAGPRRILNHIAAQRSAAAASSHEADALRRGASTVATSGQHGGAAGAAGGFVPASQIAAQQQSMQRSHSTVQPSQSAPAAVGIGAGGIFRNASFGDVSNVFLARPSAAAATDGGSSSGNGGAAPSAFHSIMQRRSFDIGVYSYDTPAGVGTEDTSASTTTMRNPYARSPSASASQGGPRVQLTSSPSSLMAVLSGNAPAHLRDQRPRIEHSPAVQAAMARLEAKGVRWMRHIDGRVSDRRSVFEASAAFHPCLTTQDVKDFVLMISNMPDVAQGLDPTKGMRPPEADKYVGSGGFAEIGGGFVRTYGAAAHPGIYAYSLDREALEAGGSRPSLDLSQSMAARALGLSEAANASQGQGGGGQRHGGHMQRMLPSTEGYDDNGETGAGTRVLGVCQRMQLRGWVVVVSRWYGGVLLGPTRFQHIQNVTSACVRAAKTKFSVGDGSSQSSSSQVSRQQMYSYN